MIVADPSPAADATRGTTCDALVEAIDLAPTFVEAFGGKVARNVMEGRSLLPLRRQAVANARSGSRSGALAEAIKVVTVTPKAGEIIVVIVFIQDIFQPTIN